MNPWIGYINRSYSSIKQILLEKLATKAPEVTDHSESNILVIILSFFAGIGESFHYYLDNLAREAFIGQASRYSSAVSLVKMIDYRIKSKISAKVDIELSLLDTAGNLLALPNDFVLPSGQHFTTNNGISFYTLHAVLLEAGKSVHVLPAVQTLAVPLLNIGTTNGNINQVIPLPEDYDHDSALLHLGLDVWELRKTLAWSTPFDKHFVVDVSVDKKPYIRFGDNINGLAPLPGQTVALDYNQTLGAEGNVDPHTINIWVNPVTIPGITLTSVTNQIKASGGADVEDLGRITRNAPLSIRTLDRAVTNQDYKDTAMLAPGVDKAGVTYDCGKWIDVYITPNDGGIAPLALLATTKSYIDFRKIITTKVRVSPAGETEIVLNLNIYGKPYMTAPQILADVNKALLEEYGYEKTDVNRPIRYSDIYALVDNLTKVNYLHIIGLTTKPYARPVYSLNQLNWERTTLPTSTQEVNWKVVWDNLNFRVFRNGVFMLNISPNVEWTDPANTLTMKFLPGDYNYGDEWVFKTYPANHDIELDDNTVPVLLLNNLSLNIFEAE